MRSGSTSMSWVDRLAEEPELRELARLVEAGGTLSARSVVGSSTVVAAAALARHLSRPLLLVVPHLDEADEAVDELEDLGISVAKFPALELLPGETSVSLELVAERLMLLRRLTEGDLPAITVTPIAALMQAVPPAQALGGLLRVVKPGDRLETLELAAWLDEVGYERVEAIEAPGEFAIRGGIIDLFSPAGAPVRIDLFGDEVEGLFEIDLDTMGSDRRLERVEIVGVAEAARPEDEPPEATFSLLDYLTPESVAILAETVEMTEQARSYLNRAIDARGLFTAAEVLKRTQQRCRAVLGLSPRRTSVGSLPDRSRWSSPPWPALRPGTGRLRQRNTSSPPGGTGLSAGRRDPRRRSSGLDGPEAASSCRPRGAANASGSAPCHESRANTRSAAG